MSSQRRKPLSSNSICFCKQNRSIFAKSASQQFSSNLLFFASLLLCVYTLVVSCSDVPSPSDHMEGRKVTVNGAQLDSPVELIQWCGNDHQTVLLQTSNGHLYKSTNGGKSWSDISDLFMVKKEDGEENVQVESIHINPIDKNIVVVFASKTTALVSENAAKTFKLIKQPQHIQAWMFHPTNPKWALLAVVSQECYRNTVEESNCNRELYVTKDLGKTAQLISKYVVQYNWGDTKHKQESYIYFTRHQKHTGNQFKVSGWSSDVDFFTTHDFGRTSRLLISGGNKFVISNEYIFVAKLKDQKSQIVSMMVSTDGGKTFSKSQLSTEIQEKSYTVLDVSEGAIMLHVNHGEEGKSDSGNIYVSDASGKHFSLSLPGNIRTKVGECEFDKVLSLEGIYLANYKDTEEQKKSSIDLMEESIIEEEDEFETQTQKRRSQKAKGISSEVVRTVISFDKGGAWYYLSPPEYDSNGTPIHCPTRHCNLNLHGITTYNQFAPFYSIETAVGIILATGNVGSQLRYEPNEVNTYLSRDGGLSWSEIHKGAYIYEIGDNGGLLVMANDVNTTKQVVFSWNEGKSWYDFELAGEPLNVNNIVIEPNSSSLEFLLYGQRGEKGVVYHLDFKSLEQKFCHGFDRPDTYDSDYETWVPSDGRENGCMLGKKTSYIRRKQTSECFHGKLFQVSKSKQHCSCTKEDYECGLGFTRHIQSLECVPESPHQFIDKCYASSFVWMDAFIKVPGDVCEGGWVPDKVAIPCPPHAPFTAGAKTILFFLFSITIIMWGLTYISKNPNSKFSFQNQGFTHFRTPYDALRKRGTDSSMYISDDKIYEPELGFIDADQDDQDEDQPSLVNYTSPMECNLIDLDGPFSSTWQNKPVTNRRIINEAIPRIPPPPSANHSHKESDSVELI